MKPATIENAEDWTEQRCDGEGGMAMNVIGMGFAVTGHLTPVTDATTQEVIDVLAVLNLLRAAFPPKVIYDL